MWIHVLYIPINGSYALEFYLCLSLQALADEIYGSVRGLNGDIRVELSDLQIIGNPKSVRIPPVEAITRVRRNLFFHGRTLVF